MRGVPGEPQAVCLGALARAASGDAAGPLPFAGLGGNLTKAKGGCCGKIHLVARSKCVEKF